MNGFFQISLAVVLGAVLLGGAFYYRDAIVDSESVEVTASEVAVVLAPRVYQDIKDTDGDGLKDWEEELLGLDPNVPDTPEPIAVIGSASEDSGGDDEIIEELSNTVTDRFARVFFEEYFTASAFTGGELTEEQQIEFINASIGSLENEVSDDFFTQADIRTGTDNSAIAIREYGNVVGHIILSQPVSDEDELTILNRALKSNSAEELEKLKPILSAYENMVVGVKNTVVPPALVQHHLNFLNSLLAVRNGIAAMYNSMNDPFPALIRIKRYPDDADGLYFSVDNIRTIFEQMGIIYTEGESGLFFFSLRP